MINMRRFLPFLFIITILTLSFTSRPSIAQNNLYLKGLVDIEMNVTLINLGDEAKFLMVNPRYNFQVIRENLSESYNGIEINSPRKNVINYKLGFWVYPHEVVKIRFYINDSNPLEVPLRDFVTPQCTGNIYVENGRYFVEVPVFTSLAPPICDLMFPPLINSPMYLSPESLFNFRDPSLVLYSYEGLIKFKLIHNSSYKQGYFRDVIAVSPPILFPNAKVYGYYPHPTMNYTEYIEYLKGALGFKSTNIQAKMQKLDNNFMLYDVKLGLISTKIDLISVKNVKFKKVDYPIWVIWIGDNSSIEITYKFEWSRGEASE
ncbi:317aa long hypothetical protein [Pyrococcus horikoshii OT3]|uniref:Uncharacterized protein n=2 Tax=Pyrococcus horikoshii TaxID=53953 RepID=O58383_PYRHO|nr:317aa long hypothetical protein [Pyrococcus horikoshii OT3]